MTITNLNNLKLRFLPAVPGTNALAIANAAEASAVRAEAAAVAAAATTAPTSAEYITASTNAVLSAERVLTDTATISWDFATPGQAKATSIAGGGNVSTTGIPAVLDELTQWVTATTVKGLPITTLFASPALTGSPTAPTAAAANNSTMLATTAFCHTVTDAAATTAAAATAATEAKIVPQGGILQFVSTTSLSFKPFNGNKIKIAGVLYDIPTAGIAGLGSISSAFVSGVASTSLAINTTYLVTAFINGGVVTANFQPGGATHVTDTTAGNVGVEVLNGSPAHTVIGLVRTYSTLIFVDQAQFRGVRSWFNSRPLTFQGVNYAGATTTSTSNVELNGGASRAEFVSWAGEHIYITNAGSITNTTMGFWTASGIGIDSTTAVAATNALVFQHGTGSNYVSFSQNFTTSSLSEGYHFIVPLGAVQGTTGSWPATSFISGILCGL